MNPTDNRKTKLQPNDAISDQAGIVHTQFRQHPELVIELATEPCFNRTVQVHSFPFWWYYFDQYSNFSFASRVNGRQPLNCMTWLDEKLSIIAGFRLQKDRIRHYITHCSLRQFSILYTYFFRLIKYIFVKNQSWKANVWRQKMKAFSEKNNPRIKNDRSKEW